MTEGQIFEHLFSISDRSDDSNGIVTACLVREGKVISEAVSMDDGVHAEYALLKDASSGGISILAADIVYTTVEPCSRRTPGGRGERMGDCATNLIAAGVKHVVYAAKDPDAGETEERFRGAGVEMRQATDDQIVARAIKLFNSTSGSRQPA